MPKLNGVEAIKKIREFEGNDWPWTIGYSASAMQSEIESPRENGMDDFLSKPARLAELKDCLDRYIKRA